MPPFVTGREIKPSGETLIISRTRGTFLGATVGFLACVLVFILFAIDASRPDWHGSSFFRILNFASPIARESFFLAFAAFFLFPMSVAAVRVFDPRLAILSPCGVTTRWRWGWRSVSWEDVRFMKLTLLRERTSTIRLLPREDRPSDRYWPNSGVAIPVYAGSVSAAEVKQYIARFRPDLTASYSE